MSTATAITSQLWRDSGYILSWLVLPRTKQVVDTATAQIKVPSAFTRILLGTLKKTVATIASDRR